MKTIQVEIKGVTPLLMHNAANMDSKSIKKNPTKEYDDEAYAESVTYRDEDGDLCVPARCIKASILNASAWFKAGKRSMKQIVAGCTRIEPYDIKLGVKEYEIDRRPVVVQRSRIMRARPLIKKWKLKFNIVYNEAMLKGESIDTLRQIIEEAGQRVGLLDNRPQKYGENGCFEVTKFLPK